MPLRRLAITSALALVVIAAAPARASADWLFTPYFGVNWGGSADFNQFNDSFED